MGVREDVLSGEQREGFKRDGYIVIDPGLAADVLERAVSDLEGLFSEEPRQEDGVLYYPKRIQDAWKINESVKAIALDPTVLAVLEQLYGRRPLPFQTLNFRVGTEQAAHSDTVHFNCEPPGFMAGAWVALEDMDMDNGPLVYYPGSHELPEISMKDVGVEGDPSEYGHYERFMIEQIERRGLEPQYATIRKGELLVWSANLLHGGSPQRDRQRTRHSQVTHYFFEGCKYYSPLSTRDDYVHWLDPVWIS
jgi:ectoine hydroxylase-related dioxygenase (phytanoyl-CoA dioxygenase family)